jgi:cysteine desulfurase
MAARIYLDYAATTPVDPLVAAVMNECLTAEGDFANPASITHEAGRRARARVEAARAEVAALVGAAPSEIVFTSGATESNNLAILGVARANVDRGRHLITSRIEHRAVLDPCRRLEREGFTVTYLKPDRAGLIGPESLAAALREDTVLVSLMHVNNEIGVIQDLAAFAALCAARGVPLHTDAAQSAGKVPLDVRTLPVDFVSFTAHKIYGPKGIGALFVRSASRARLQPVVFGGGHEGGLRAGTLPTHQISGFAAACTLVRQRGMDGEYLMRLRERLWEQLASLDGVELNGAGAPRTPGILSVSFEGVDGESLVAALTPLAVATGSACSSASAEPSYVLRALGRSSSVAQSTLRLSLGRYSTEADVNRAAKFIRRAICRLRSVSPSSKSAGIVENQDTIDDDTYAIGFDILTPEARRLFAHLPGAGRLEPGADVVQGEGGGEAAEAWVRFYARIAGGIVRDARFQARGCPHTLAVTAWLTGRLPQQALRGLSLGKPAEWAQALAVPVEKLGRLLMVEDALLACLRAGENVVEC